MLARVSNDQQSAVLSQRNRLITLLLDRMQIIRRAARYIFRSHPRQARKFSSAYERTKRRASRRAQRKANAGSPAEPNSATGSYPPRLERRPYFALREVGSALTERVPPDERPPCSGAPPSSSH